MKLIIFSAILICLLLVPAQSRKQKTHGHARDQPAANQSQPAQPNANAANAINRLINVVPRIQKNVGIQKPKIVLEHTKSQVKNPEFDAKLYYEKQCSIKQGFLAHVDDIDQQNQQLFGTLAFAVLNKNNLALFENENVNSLIDTVQLKLIGKLVIPVKWVKKQFFCFQIVPGLLQQKEKNFVDEDLLEPHPDSRINLCAVNQAQLNQWVTAIKDLLYKCTLTPKEFIKQQQIVKEKRMQLGEQMDFFTSKMAKNAEQLKKQEEQNQSEDEEIGDTIKSQYGKIIDSVEQQKQAELELIRKLELQRSKINAKTNKINEEKECLEATLKAKTEQELEVSSILMKEEEKNKDKLVLDTTQKNIQKLKQKELELIKKNEQELNEEALLRQKQAEQEVIQEIFDAETLLDPAVCVSPELKNNTEQAMRKACGALQVPGQIPDVIKIQKCMYKPQFCQQCCNHFIGVNYVQKREQCKLSCYNQLFEQNFEEHKYDYMVRIKSENQLPNDTSISYAVGNNTQPSVNMSIPLDKQILAPSPYALPENNTNSVNSTQQTAQVQPLPAQPQGPTPAQPQVPTPAQPQAPQPKRRY